MRAAASYTLVDQRPLPMVLPPSSWPRRDRRGQRERAEPAGAVYVTEHVIELGEQVPGIVGAGPRRGEQAAAGEAVQRVGHAVAHQREHAVGGEIDVAAG